MQRLEWHCHTNSVSGALYKAILYHGQSAGKEMANSAVFNFRRNAGSDWISLTKVGREFQARDAAAGNAQSPLVARHVGGTTSVDVEADSSAPALSFWFVVFLTSQVARRTSTVWSARLATRRSSPPGVQCTSRSCRASGLSATVSERLCGEQDATSSWHRPNWRISRLNSTSPTAELQRWKKTWLPRLDCASQSSSFGLTFCSLPLNLNQGVDVLLSPLNLNHGGAQ